MQIPKIGRHRNDNQQQPRDSRELDTPLAGNEHNYASTHTLGDTRDGYSQPYSNQNNYGQGYASAATNGIQQSPPTNNTAFPPVRVHLTPMAPPAAMGLAAYATGSFILATWLSAWYGNPETAFQIWPLLLTFGGIGQMAAGFFSFRARDTLASIFFTMWGSYFMAVALYLAFMGAGVVPLDDRYNYNEALGIWMAPLAALTYILTAGSMFRDWVWTGTLFMLATGSVCGVFGWFLHSAALIKILGYFWIVSSVLAMYRVAVYVMHEALPHRKNDILPRFAHPVKNQQVNKGWQWPYAEQGVVTGY
ncbi:hypothetical protein DFS34DRAFT_252935 [Phlyctochytrium arcticum]|nr:hypothetical protein DFS34DRAFT_252935 [Phlyctochytrium arcticum]